MSPQQKGMFVSILKKEFPQKIVMTVGDSSGDYFMFENSDVAVQVVDQQLVYQLKQINSIKKEEEDIHKGKKYKFF